MLEGLAITGGGVKLMMELKMMSTINIPNKQIGQEYNNKTLI